MNFNSVLPMRPLEQGRLSFSIFQILGGMKAKKSQKPSEF